MKKYESLPAELESIKAVLEMKNEEIRQLRKEKMEKHLEVKLSYLVLWTTGSLIITYSGALFLP